MHACFNVPIGIYLTIQTVAERMGLPAQQPAAEWKGKRGRSNSFGGTGSLPIDKLDKKVITTL